MVSGFGGKRGRGWFGLTGLTKGTGWAGLFWALAKQNWMGLGIFGLNNIKDPFVFLEMKTIGTKNVNCRNLRGLECNFPKLFIRFKLAKIE